MRMSIQCKILVFVNIIFFSSIITCLAIEQKKIPNDVSFCIADLKYDGKNLKILEFGDSGQSLFNGHDALYGRGSVWQKFWNYLVRFELPVWYVGYLGKSTASDAFKCIGGQSAQSVVRLQGMVEADARAKGIRNFKNYKGIVFIRREHQRDAIEVMRRKFPSLIFINQAAYSHIVNKHNTNLLFQDDQELSAYRPVCKSSKKRYTPTLAKSIVDQIKSNLYVVKPTDGSRGRGVIFVTKDELDSTLKTILYDREALKKMCNQLPYCYGFWQFGQAKNFLIEEYVPSKPITVQGKQYDATMRLIFATYRINGQVGIDILGAYWKLPAKALDEEGSFVQKHRSDIHATTSIGSAKVSAQDLKGVTELFCPMMEKIYNKMLTQYYGE